MEKIEIKLYDPETNKITRRVKNEEELKVMQKRFPRLLAVHFKWEE